MQATQPAWYCARIKPKRLHTFAAIRRGRWERPDGTDHGGLTGAGWQALIEGGMHQERIFARSDTNVPQTLRGPAERVHSEGKNCIGWPPIIKELQACVGKDDLVIVDRQAKPADDLAAGCAAGCTALAGRRIRVSKRRPMGKRVQILLEQRRGPASVESKDEAGRRQEEHVGGRVAWSSGRRHGRDCVRKYSQSAEASSFEQVSNGQVRSLDGCKQSIMPERFYL